jgi:hypothetical protein
MFNVNTVEVAQCDHFWKEKTDYINQTIIKNKYSLGIFELFWDLSIWIKLITLTD